MCKKSVDISRADGDSHHSRLQIILLEITDHDASKPQCKTCLHIKFYMVQCRPVLLTNICILHEELMSLRILIGPFLCSKLLLEEVGVEYNSSAKKVC